MKENTACDPIPAVAVHGVALPYLVNSRCHQSGARFTIADYKLNQISRCANSIKTAVNYSLVVANRPRGIL